MPIAVIISIVSVAFSAFFGLFTLAFNLKNNKKSDNSELTERVRENTKINIKLDTISSNTTEIKNEVLEMRKEINSHDNRIVKVEESVKSAHHRIDGLETRINSDKEDKGMDFTQVPTVVAIIVITYLIGYASKQIPQVKDNIIPIIVGVAGGILGVVGMFVIPGYPADNILDAIAVGIVSGMASTGVNQIYKQIKNNA